MGKSSQNEKRSLLRTRLVGIAARLKKGPQKSNKAMSPIVESEQSVIQPFVGAKSAYQNQKSEESEGLGKDRFACVPEEHVKPEKQKKAIEHIEKLLEKISQLQDEIDNDLQAEIHLEREMFDLLAVNEPSSHQTPQRKRVKEYRKQQAEELSVTNKLVHKSRKQSQRKTQKDDSHPVNNRKLGKKLCLRCKKQKTKSDFHKDRSCKDGLAIWCKECKAKAAKKYRKKQTVR